MKKKKTSRTRSDVLYKTDCQYFGVSSQKLSHSLRSQVRQPHAKRLNGLKARGFRVSNKT